MAPLRIARVVKAKYAGLMIRSVLVFSAADFDMLIFQQKDRPFGW
jgi:hypothetical protein